MAATHWEARTNEGGQYADQLRYNRHAKGANYIYADGHVEFPRWRKARND